MRSDSYRNRGREVTMSDRIRLPFIPTWPTFDGSTAGPYLGAGRADCPRGEPCRSDGLPSRFSGARPTSASQGTRMCLRLQVESCAGGGAWEASHRTRPVVASDIALGIGCPIIRRQTSAASRPSVRPNSSSHRSRSPRRAASSSRRVSRRSRWGSGLISGSLARCN